MEKIGIRAATRADADVVCALLAALSAEEGMEPPALTPALFRKQGFGPDPLFTCLLAERRGRVAGVALLTRGYDSQSALAGLVLENLYVEPLARRAGVGRALIQASARLALDRGLGWLSWHMRPANLRAALFYRSLGAETETVTLMGISGEGLRRITGCD
jgi:GNAT superfamily N-acetyltransferase